VLRVLRVLRELRVLRVLRVLIQLHPKVHQQLPDHEIKNG
jgi:hypothetical protein